MRRIEIPDVVQGEKPLTKTIKIPDEVHSELKVLSARVNKSIQKLTIAALLEYIERNEVENRIAS